MSILIRGMGLPTYGATNVLMFQNGEVYGMKYWFDKWELLGQAIELPPHGRLIDADALMSVIAKNMKEAKQADNYDWWNACSVAGDFLMDAPTIIPADPAEEDET